MILFTNQVSALPTLMTFGENHEFSIISSNGETFLKLEHSHKHKFHHHLKAKNHKHNHANRIASIFNGHDGKHSDHLIKISNSKEDLSTRLTSSQTFDLEPQDTVATSLLSTQLKEQIENKVQPSQKNRLTKDLKPIEFSVQFLV
jgi:hypothetical protein